MSIPGGLSNLKLKDDDIQQIADFLKEDVEKNK